MRQNGRKMLLMTIQWFIFNLIYRNMLVEIEKLNHGGDSPEGIREKDGSVISRSGDGSVICYK